MLEHILFFSIAVLSIVFHEVAHGLVAFWLGDSTAKDAGRLTVNPLKHVDLVGTILVPLALRLMGISPLGWAKPVPVNFHNLRRPKRDMIFVAAAGPGINVLLAVLSSVMIHAFVGPRFVQDVLSYAVGINLVLAIFNALPIPPLDGSKIIMGLMPNQLAYHYAKWERFGIIIVLILLNIGLFEVIIAIAAVLARWMGINLI